ncbi:Ribokinase-like protein [Chytridium lagenaria]|nr:Ribokinase-like protein [Chytridium lagenaria]
MSSDTSPRPREPLLDISATVDKEFLAKYNLKDNDAILAGEEHKPIYDELVSNYKVDYNTLRGAQWLLPAKSTVYIGAVGKDATADKLAPVLCSRHHPTGKCGVLITGHHRSLVTDLQAANTYTIDHLKKPEIWALVENAKFFYVGGYFLTVFMMNMSAPFIPQFFKSQLDALSSYWDVLFGNEAEALSYSESHSLNITDIKEIAFTSSPSPRRTLLVPPCVDEYEVHAVPEEDIVDTNGAGDAFCGGYLAAFVSGKSIKDCVLAGQYVAAVVIQRTGPTYPREAPTISYARLKRCCRFLLSL